ncbi:hypothetical protein DFH09DRAFT_225328 [Mycena vulgaris]|nr:hypothetical protein DFH09DRAFT_225328 [Mycena vulgaris]
MFSFSTMTTSQPPNLAERLAQREKELHFDIQAQTADLPSDNASRKPLPGSIVAFVAWQTIRRLVEASEEVYMDLFGAIVTSWPGSTKPTIEEQLADEAAWVQTYFSECHRAYFSEIRTALAETRFTHIESQDLPAAAHRLGCSPASLLKSVALHQRAPPTLTPHIYIAPFLPSAENAIRAEMNMSRPERAAPGLDMDVLVVCTYKAVVHEAQHIAGTIVHGALYTTPKLIQDAFQTVLQVGLEEESTVVDSEKEDVAKDLTESIDGMEEEDGEIGDWYEATRYGAFGSPMLLSKHDYYVASEWYLRLGGYLPGDPFAQQLLDHHVAAWAANIQRGQSLSAPHRFFEPRTTTSVQLYSLCLEDIGSPPNLPTLSASPSPRAGLRSSQHHTTTMNSHGSMGNRKLKKVSEIRRLGDVGYPNFHGVLRARST